MRGNYSCRFPASPHFLRQSLAYEITQKKTPRVRDVFESSKVGGRREFFWKKNRLLGATAPSLPCRLQPAYFLEQRRFNAKAIAIAPKIAAYSAGSGT